MARIVVAEDDADISGLIATLLATLEHDVVFFGDGASALQECRRRRPDLAILDIIMPRMTGLEVLQAIREDEDLADLPVLLLTALAREVEVARGIKSGATAYMAKPFRIRELVREVQGLLHEDAKNAVCR